MFSYVRWANKSLTSFSIFAYPIKSRRCFLVFAKPISLSAKPIKSRICFALFTKPIRSGICFPMFATPIKGLRFVLYVALVLVIPYSWVLVWYSDSYLLSPPPPHPIPPLFRLFLFSLSRHLIKQLESCVVWISTELHKSIYLLCNIYLHNVQFRLL